jgi:hypothetical protein
MNYESGPVPTSAVASRRYASGYENLTWKQQEAARALPKGIYVENIISKIRLLRSAMKEEVSVTSLAALASP